MKLAVTKREQLRVAEIENLDRWKEYFEEILNKKMSTFNCLTKQKKNK